MTSKIFKTVLLPVLLIIVLSLVLFQIPKQCYGTNEIDIGIDLAQNLINLQSSITTITFHTSIKFYVVDCSTVTLMINTGQPVYVPVYMCTSDSRGYLKAHFLMQSIRDIKNYLNIGEENLFVLSGYTKDGTLFYGSQLLLVEDNQPQYSR